jgi:hypothetical protein
MSASVALVNLSLLEARLYIRYFSLSGHVTLAYTTQELWFTLRSTAAVHVAIH